MLIALIVGLIVLGVVGLFFLFRWLFSPYRRALRQARRACRKAGINSDACKRYRELQEKGTL